MLHSHLIRIAIATALGLCSSACLAAPATSLTAKDMTECANGAIDYVKSVEGVVLPYSIEGLVKIDSVLDHYHRRGYSFEQTQDQTMLFGCFVGEMMVRNLGAAWYFPSEEEANVIGKLPVIRLKNGTLFNPIGKARKAAENGMEDSIAKFYRFTAGLAK